MTSPSPSSAPIEQLSRAERLLDLVAPKLQLVETELARNFESNSKTIKDVVDHILAGRGTRTRPARLLPVSRRRRYEGHSA